MIDLQECRNEIDKIDSDIIRLFEQRMKVCEDVAEYKIRTGKKAVSYTHLSGGTEPGFLGCCDQD